jgi:hypothetical protein
MNESSNKPQACDWVSALLEPGFELPEDSTFHSQRGVMTYSQFLELSERHLPAANTSGAVQQSRLERKFDEPFVLFD